MSFNIVFSPQACYKIHKNLNSHEKEQRNAIYKKNYHVKRCKCNMYTKFNKNWSELLWPAGGSMTARENRNCIALIPHVVTPRVSQYPWDEKVRGEGPLTFSSNGFWEGGEERWHQERSRCNLYSSEVHNNRTLSLCVMWVHCGPSEAWSQICLGCLANSYGACHATRTQTAPGEFVQYSQKDEELEQLVLHVAQLWYWLCQEDLLRLQTPLCTQHNRPKWVSVSVELLLLYRQHHKREQC